MRMGPNHCLANGNGSDQPGAGQTPTATSASPSVVDDDALAGGGAPSAAANSDFTAATAAPGSADAGEAATPSVPEGHHSPVPKTPNSEGEDRTLGTAAETGPSPPPLPPASASHKVPPRSVQGGGSTLLSDLYKPPSPKGPFDSGELKKLLLLLVEFGGTFGTAAVVLGFFLKIDPFGEFHW